MSTLKQIILRMRSLRGGPGNVEAQAEPVADAAAEDGNGDGDEEALD